MDGGVYLGGYYKPKTNTVPTFLVNNDLDEWYYVKCPGRQFKKSKAESVVSRTALGKMHKAAPTILAFWSDEE